MSSTASTFFDKIQRIDYAFQPIVNIHTGECYGYEALIRKSEEAGFSSIDAIFEEAFESGVLHEADLILREKAIAKFNINPAQSWLIGDRARDIECGQRIGLKTVLITENQLDRCSPDLVAENLMSAVIKIL